MRGFAIWAISAALAGLSPGARGEAPTDAVQVVLDRSEADAALAIIESENAGRKPTAEQTSALFSSRPYIRLRERENAMKRPFTDEEFLAYLGSPPVRSKERELRATLVSWRQEQITAAATRAFAYLPANSKLRATIFPMIKIKPNTFVFDVQKDPAIFYALDPAEAPAKFANTLAHELHHIGLGQNCLDEDKPGPPGVTALRGWVSAFGEGLAMLAAAGGPNVHPHADSTAKERALWDSETAKFATYLAQQDTYFRAVLAGKAGSKDDVDKAMFAYFGEQQGPWYSVGWRMAVTIERNLGRPAVIDAFCRPATLLSTYNRAAKLQARRGGKRLPTWNPALAKALAG